MSGPWHTAAQRLYGKLLDLAYRLAARVDRLGGGKLIGLLVICVVLIYPLNGVLYDFHHDSGRGSVIVDVLSEVVWRVYSLVQVALIVLLAMAAYRYVTKTIQGPKSSGARSKQATTGDADEKS